MKTFFRMIELGLAMLVLINLPSTLDGADGWVLWSLVAVSYLGFQMGRRFHAQTGVEAP